MRVGGFIISEDHAKALTRIIGDDEKSRDRRDMQMTKLIRQHGAILELVTYPKHSTRDEDVKYLLATAYDYFSQLEFYHLGRDISRLPQFTHGELEERVQVILDNLGAKPFIKSQCHTSDNGLGIDERKFVTCWKNDHLVCPTAEALRVRDFRRMASGKDDAVVPSFLLSY
ncbi:hypothetical protein VKT23_002639 [Stygiomarasmius scandens]|uniref:Uncharacterized protein n=1 Tax=Marasmiellus scandens TaxID=2682957 RepID=A0ABR1K4H4_9AGAR